MEAYTDYFSTFRWEHQSLSDKQILLRYRPFSPSFVFPYIVKIPTSKKNNITCRFEYVERVIGNICAEFSFIWKWNLEENYLGDEKRWNLWNLVQQENDENKRVKQNSQRRRASVSRKLSKLLTWLVFTRNRVPYIIDVFLTNYRRFYAVDNLLTTQIERKIFYSGYLSVQKVCNIKPDDPSRSILRHVYMNFFSYF